MMQRHPSNSIVVNGSEVDQQALAILAAGSYFGGQPDPQWETSVQNDLRATSAIIISEDCLALLPP